MYSVSSGVKEPESASVPLSGSVALVGSESDASAELDADTSVWLLLSSGMSLAGRISDQMQNAIITTPSLSLIHI